MEPCKVRSAPESGRDPFDRKDPHGRPSRPGVSWGKLVISLLVAAGIVVILFRLTAVSPKVVLETLEGVSPAVLFMGLVLHMVAYLLRSLRFRLLIRSARPPVRSLFEIVSVHNLMNHVLPLRAGELSYVYLVRTLHDVPVAEGLGTLAICRIMDLMAFTLYYPAAVVLLHLEGFAFPSYVWKVLWIIVPLFLVMAGGLATLSLKGDLLVRLVRSVIRRGPVRRSGWSERILEGVERTAASFGHLGDRRVYLGAFLLSMGILGLVYGVAYLLLAGMGYPMKIQLVIFCSTLAYLGLILPFYAFGGFGTLEAGWTAGCLMAGFSKEMGMASGFSFHVIALGYVFLMGAFGLVRLGRPLWAGKGREGNGAAAVEQARKGEKGG